MTTATKSRTKKPQSRTFTILEIAGPTVLSITQDGVSRAYLVTPLPHAFGNAAFKLDKSDNGDRKTESYNVLLAHNGSTCDCADCTYRSRACKHILALQGAIDAGKLKAVPMVERKVAPPACGCKSYEACKCEV